MLEFSMMLTRVRLSSSGKGANSVQRNVAPTQSVFVLYNNRIS